jgi:hypothetical protein
VERRALKRSTPRGADVLDLTAGSGAGVGGTGLSLAEARAFYRDHGDEILSRMRHPTNLTSNPAAAIVAQCEPDPRLRTEALCAVDDARRARDARDVLERALEVYAPMHRPASLEPARSVRAR